MGKEMSDVEVQMLTKADDYPIHQTPEPVAYAGLGRNFYDRYFFNGYHKEEDLFFALGMGIYPPARHNGRWFFDNPVWQTEKSSIL